MYWLLALPVVAVLFWAWRLDHRGSEHERGKLGLDEVRTRVEGSMITGKDWLSPRG